jgi:DivIVA domain-containing protein
MPFSPEEILSKTFPESPTEGYDRAEVDHYLRVLASLYAALSDGSDSPALSEQAARLVRAATQWSEARAKEARDEAEAIQRRARRDLDASHRRAEAETAKAKASGRKRAERVISDANSEAAGIRARAVQEIQRQGDAAKKSAALMKGRKRLLEEIETVDRISLRLRTDLAHFKEDRADDVVARIVIVSHDDRSLGPMVAAVLRDSLMRARFAGVHVTSAGIEADPGGLMDEGVQRFLNTCGLGLPEYRTRSIDGGELLRADLVVAVSLSDKDAVAARVPEANLVLLSNLEAVSLPSNGTGLLRERIRSVPAHVTVSSDTPDLPDAGEWPWSYRRCFDEIQRAIGGLVATLSGRDSVPRSIPMEEQGPSDEDSTFFDWLRHYAVLIAITVFVGLFVAGVYLVLGSRLYEASTLVVDTGREFTARQLAVVSQATFRSPAVVGPTIEELGVDTSIQEFLDSSVDLRPVPDTNTLMVIGRSNSLPRAQEISEAASRSFVTASNERTDLTEFVIFGRSQSSPIQQHIAAPVAFALGGAVGFWIGIILAVVHYRWKRPILSFTRALTASGADHITIVAGKWSWLGALRPGPRMSGVAIPRASSNRMGAYTTNVQDTASGGEDGARVVLAHSGTQERELDLAGHSTGRMNGERSDKHVRLVWMR